MTTLDTPAMQSHSPSSEVQRAAAGPTPSDLADLMSSFSEVTTKLEATHVRLQSEVSRLSSELADANEELARSRRLAALGEMAAGIAHEIRNPLGSIGLYARLLVEDLAEQAEPLGIARKIAGAVHRLDAIVTDVLAFARELRVRKEPVEAGMIIELALEACEADLRRGGEGLDVRVQGTDVAMECDCGLLQQAMVNLIRNACEAMAGSGGGQLSLRAEIRLGEASRRGAAVLSVRDTGPGIPTEVIDRIFNPFFTTRETGTGLGLAIVHRIIDAHGGRVDVYNNIERGGEAGTTVELHLPLPVATAGRETNRKRMSA